MFKFLKRSKKDDPSLQPAEQAEQTGTASDEQAAAEVEPSSKEPQTEIESTTAPAKPSMFTRLRHGLQRTRNSLGKNVGNLLLGKKKIDEDLLDELESQLLIADMGVEVSQLVIKNLTEKVSRKQLTDSEALYAALKEELTTILKPASEPLTIPNIPNPYVILVVGVNGNGKTTTIGKLAKRLQKEGKKVMLAAGDTYRAAAIEQLQVWGQRNDIPVIAQQPGSDSAAVIYDAMQAAAARNIDVLIADTAGRLHTQQNLMDELKKVHRVIGKADENAPHETMLIVDAGTGQNALRQAEEFHRAVNLTGITLTKLDGTAKGGAIFAVANKMQIPIRYLGVGESIDDLKTFNSDEFIEALFEND